MKKRKIFSIISSILCSFAFVGLFAIGLVLDHNQKASETKAESSTTLLYRNGFSTVMSISNNVDSNTYTSTGYFSGTYEYFQTFIQGVPNYRWRINFNCYFDFYIGEDTYTYQVSQSGGLPLFTNVDFYTSWNSTQLNVFDFDFLGYNSINVAVYRNKGLCFTLNTEALPTEYYLYPASESNELPEGYTINTFIHLVRTSQVIGNVVNVSFTPEIYDEYQNGYNEGYLSGFADGNTDGNAEGYTNGYENGSADGYAQGYAVGYGAGYDEGTSQDATVTSIFNGITTVALVPVKFFLSVFNFEILGVNIASVVSALMSICIILIVWRSVMGGKSDD